MRRLIRLLALLSSMASMPPASAATLALHVAPNGNDAWSGQQAVVGAGDGPLRTLVAAQRVARRALAAGQAVRVLIQPGLYPLSEPLEFGPADSGTAEQPTVYEATEAGRAVISGGQVLKLKATKAGEALYVAPAVGAAFWAGGPQLYVNGQRAVLAREPDDGHYWFAGQPVAVPGEASRSLGHEAFRAEPAALAFVQRLSAEERERTLVHVMQSWTSGRHHLAPSAPADALRLIPGASRPFLHFGPSQRYYVENVAAALDSPGEWLGSPAGVRYRLQPGDRTPPIAVLPLLDQLVVVRGAGAAGPFVQHLVLRGLAFEHSRALTPLGGWVDTQAAVGIGAAIQVDHARHLVLEGCQIRATGGHAVWLREGVRDSTIAGCTMHDLGGGAVKIGLPSNRTGRGPAGDSSATGANRVHHNRISRTGQQFPGAVAVWVGPSFDNEIAHNTISDTTYTAISVGWQWGYGAASSGSNRIVGNALLDIGGGMLADLGGIYTLGISPGTVIADNLIHEVRGYKNHGSGAWGIYNDEGSSDLRVENNVVIGTDSGGYHLHYGRNLVVQGNLLAWGDTAEVLVTRSDPSRTRLVLRDNLIVSNVPRPFSGYAQSPDAEFERNLVAAGRAGGALDLKACGSGCSQSNAAVAFGNGPLDLKITGLPPEAARHWSAVAAKAGAGAAAHVPVASPQRKAAPAESPAAQAPPLQATLDLANVAERERPPGWHYAPETPTEALQTVADPSAPGERCLEINDSAVYARAYEPFFYAQLNHVRGTSSVSFAVRIDEGSELIHQWRDDASPYAVGPSLRITRAGVTVGNHVVAPAQLGRWMQLRVTAPVADAGNWQLEVTDANGKGYKASGLPPRTPGWRGLRWLGFIGAASVTARACLAAVQVRNEPEPRAPAR